MLETIKCCLKNLYSDKGSALGLLLTVIVLNDFGCTIVSASEYWENIGGCNCHDNVKPIGENSAITQDIE